MSSQTCRYKIFSALIFTFCFMGLANAQLSEGWNPGTYYSEKCKEVSRFVVENKFKVNCHKTYQHFNTSSSKHYKYSKVIKKKKVKMGAFNLWHLGSKKSSFKDYLLVAKLINEFDVMAVSEILPVLGRNLIHNEALIEYLEENKSLISKTKFNQVKSLYRMPGYLKLLFQLQKLDSSWSLILSPTAESNEKSYIKEYVGYYYRGSTVKPIANEHCLNNSKSGSSFACYGDFSKKFLTKDYRRVFSRTPFLASFKSGKFDFSLLSSHVVHTSPNPEKYPARMKQILYPTFNVKTYAELDFVGMTKMNYARLAESKIILEFMEKYSATYVDKDIIYLGDMNLSANNNLLKTMAWNSDFELFIKSPTSVTPRRYNEDGDETFGKSSNYDHFIFNREKTKECETQKGKVETGVYDFTKGSIAKEIYSKYVIRKSGLFNIDDLDLDQENDKQPDYGLISGGKAKMNKLLKNYEKSLLKKQTLNDGIIVEDLYKIEFKKSSFKRRVFTQQLYDSSYYKIYVELISDHYPIFLNCRNNTSFD